MTAFAPTYNLQQLAETVRLQLQNSRLADCSREWSSDGFCTLTCRTSSGKVEVEYSPGTEGGLPNYRRFLLQKPGPGAPLILENNSELAERSIHHVGAILINYFAELNSAAASAGTSIFSKAFDDKSGLPNLPINNLRIETSHEGGKTVVCADLIAADLRLGHYPGRDLPSHDDRRVFAATHEDSDRLETVTLGVELSVRDNPTNPFEAQVEILIRTANGCGMSFISKEAKIIFASIISNPSLAARKDLSIRELAHSIRAHSRCSSHLSELFELHQQLNDALLFCFSDTTPIDRSAIEQGDLIAHLTAGTEPGLVLELYRVTRLGPTVTPEERAASTTLTYISADGKRVREFFKRPDHEGDIRMIEETQLPDRSRGALSFVIDPDLRMRYPYILRPYAIGADEPRIDVRANRTWVGEEADARIESGRFLYRQDITDPFTLSLARLLNLDQPLSAAAPHAEADPLILHEQSTLEHTVLERLILDRPHLSFNAPGIWRLPNYIRELLAQYHQALANCSYDDVIFLNLEMLSKKC